MNSEWQKDFFSRKLITDFWSAAVSPAHTALEADFLASIFPAKGRVLDIPSGNGRVALALAAKGFSACGVDISENFIREAREEAQKIGADATFVFGDMREISFDADFDGAFCLGNSFGYFEYSHLQKFVRAVGRALRPNASFVVNTGMVAESLLPNLHDRGWFEVGEFLFMIENHYLATESCLETSAMVLHDGQTEKVKWWHWVHTVGELKRLITDAGFRVTGLYGDLNKQPYKLKDHQLYLVAEKC